MVLTRQQLPPEVYVRDDDSELHFPQYEKGRTPAEQALGSSGWVAGDNRDGRDRGLSQINMPPYIALYFCTPET